MVQEYRFDDILQVVNVPALVEDDHIGSETSLIVRALFARYNSEGAFSVWQSPTRIIELVASTSLLRIEIFWAAIQDLAKQRLDDFNGLFEGGGSESYLLIGKSQTAFDA